MKINLLALFLLLGIQSAYAQDACPKVQCDEFTDVAISFFSSDLNEDFRTRYAAQNSPNVPAGLVNEGRVRTEHLSQIKTKIKSLARECKRVKYLSLVGHGSVGHIKLGNSLTIRNMEFQLGGLHCAMAENATIEIDSCNTGRGCRGEDFMRSMAFSLLKGKGGTIIANDQYALSLFGSPIINAGGRPQRLTVNGDLDDLRWRHAPKSSRYCRRLSMQYAQNLEETKDDIAGSCDVSNVFLMNSIDISVRDLEVAALGELQFFREVTPITPRYLRFARDYYHATTNYHRRIEALEDVDCRNFIERLIY